MPEDDQAMSPADFPEFPPMDKTGTVDLWQLRHNLSLTPEQRLEQYFNWLEFLEAAREAGRKLYGLEPRALKAAE